MQSPHSRSGELSDAGCRWVGCRVGVLSAFSFQLSAFSSQLKKLSRIEVFAMLTRETLSPAE